MRRLTLRPMLAVGENDVRIERHPVASCESLNGWRIQSKVMDSAAGCRCANRMSGPCTPHPVCTLTQLYWPSK